MRTVIYDEAGQVASDTDTRTLAQARAETLAVIREEAGRRIEASWPLFRQMNTLRAGGPAAVAMGAEIDAIRAASNVAEAAAQAATTHADLYRVTFAPPEDG